VIEWVINDTSSSLTELGFDADDDGYRSGTLALIDRSQSLGGGRVLAVTVRHHVVDEAPCNTDDFVGLARAARLFVVEVDPSPEPDMPIDENRPLELMISSRCRTEVRRDAAGKPETLTDLRVRAKRRLESVFTVDGERLFDVWINEDERKQSADETFYSASEKRPVVPTSSSSSSPAIRDRVSPAIWGCAMPSSSPPWATRVRRCG